MLAKGLGGDKDPVQAVRWYRTSAGQGDPNGLASLGVSYMTGTGVPQDPAEAVRLFRAAPRKDHRSRRTIWASGVARDDREAVEWSAALPDEAMHRHSGISASPLRLAEA